MGKTPDHGKTTDHGFELMLMLKETPPEVCNRKGHSPRIPRKIDNLSDHRLHPPVLIHEPLLEITLDKNCLGKLKTIRR